MRYLLVGSYYGNTLAAQITILLHELGHVVGRLPEEFDELSGQSGRNTAEVLHFCRAEIKATAATKSSDYFNFSKHATIASYSAVEQER